MRTAKASIAVITIFFLAAVLRAEETKPFSQITPAAGKMDRGIIFNVAGLLDFESYQGGFGIKLGLEKWVIRGMLDLLIHTDPNTFLINSTVALEKHFLPGRISLYSAGFAGFGFLNLKNTTDEDNWSRTVSFPISLGGILGIELFVFDFLSLFLEYSLTMSLDIGTNSISNMGVVTREFTYDFNMDLGLGNQSKIGLVIYVTRKPQ